MKVLVSIAALINDLIMFCIARLILLGKKYDASGKHLACLCLRDYYMRKALKHIIKAAKYEVLVWKYNVLIWEDSYCEKKAKEVLNAYEKLIKGELNEDFALMIEFRDKSKNKKFYINSKELPTDEDIEWAKEVLKRKGIIEKDTK